ncbi:hypothetical protein ACJMK2_032996 [Sinanodonta woodiana]|uniref:C-type lectin domain-containing protein n=1 Tax=Sinanodonta woodiana TaxID=1069815 RepID=A0ABD3X4Z3_SINWO
MDTPESKICPPRWKGYGDQCYILLLDKRAWFDARADCQMLGGDLSSPNNQQQQDFVYSLLQYGDGHDAWIGFNDLKDESLFEWSSDKQVMYTNWDVFQPQHISSSSDCVLISSQTGGWKDDVCDRQRQYVCQMDQASSDQPTRQPAIMGCEQVSYLYC